MISDDLRKRLADFARRRERRVVGPFSKDLPCDWRPQNILNPESGMPFTDASAWELIAERLENGHPVRQQTLEKPPGAQAVVLEVDLGPTQAILFVKIQIGAERVIGRSFHPSYEKRSGQKKR